MKLSEAAQQGSKPAKIEVDSSEYKLFYLKSDNL